MGVEVRDAAAPERKKREPLVPIPADAPKLPDFKAHREAVDNVHKKIDELRAKITQMRDEEQAKRSKDNDPRKEAMEEKKKMVDNKNTMYNEMNNLRSERDAFQKELSALRKTTREQEREMREMNKKPGGNMKAEDIDKKIQELEFRLETGGCSSIKAEKRVMQEIKDLKAQRETATSVGAKTVAVDDNRLQEERLTLEIKAKQNEIDKKSEEIKAFIKKLDDKSAEIQAISGTRELDKMREERQKVSKEIDTLRAKVNEMRDEFTKKKNEYNEWKADYDKKCDEVRERRRKEREEENKRRMEEQQKKELEISALKRLNPYEDQIAICDTLITYLKGKIATQPREERKPDSRMQHFDPEQAAGKGMKVLKKDDEDFFSVAKKKPKKPADKPKAEAPKPVKAKNISHHQEKFAAFESIQVTIPHTTAEVKSCIEELNKKKVHYESFKKTKEEAMAEEKAQRDFEKAAEAARKASEEEDAPEE